MLIDILVVFGIIVVGAAVSSIIFYFLRKFGRYITTKRKYVHLFSTVSTTVDNYWFPRNTLYYISIYGITDDGKVRLIRTTMEYTTKEGAEQEATIIITILKKKYNIV